MNKIVQAVIKASQRDRADDGPEVELCRFFGNFPEGATIPCLRENETPVKRFMELMPNAKRPN